MDESHNQDQSQSQSPSQQPEPKPRPPLQTRVYHYPGRAHPGPFPTAVGCVPLLWLWSGRGHLFANQLCSHELPPPPPPARPDAAR